MYLVLEVVQPLENVKILLKSRTSPKLGLAERLKVLWITTSVYRSSAACGDGEQRVVYLYCFPIYVFV